MSNLVIVDSGGANITSLSSALERLGSSAQLSRDAEVIAGADHVLLPGVGAAQDAMTRLHDANLVEVIQNLKQPVLGICLGMQLLCDRSQEDDVDCLGIIPGTATKLKVSDACPVPNMGWCATERIGTHPVVNDMNNGDYFYFVHSYALPVSKHTLATAGHSDTFSAVIGKDNFVAAQFHPERSSGNGAQILSNFLEWVL